MDECTKRWFSLQFITVLACICRAITNLIYLGSKNIRSMVYHCLSFSVSTRDVYWKLYSNFGLLQVLCLSFCSFTMYKLCGSVYAVNSEFFCLTGIPITYGHEELTVCEDIDQVNFYTDWPVVSLHQFCICLLNLGIVQID